MLDVGAKIQMIDCRGVLKALEMGTHGAIGSFLSHLIQIVLQIL